MITKEPFVAISQLILTIPILYINRSYFINGFKNLFAGSPNMDSLVAIGSSASFIYGIIVFAGRKVSELNRVSWCSSIGRAADL